MCFFSVYNFKDPDSTMPNFINRVSREKGDRKGELRLRSILNNKSVRVRDKRKMYFYKRRFHHRNNPGNKE